MCNIVAFYKGRPATDLTREELIVAYTDVCQQLVEQRRIAVDDAEIKKLFADTARALASMRPAEAR